MYIYKYIYNLLLFCIIFARKSIRSYSLVFFRNSPSINKSDQLNELLQYDKKAKNCSYNNDSVYTLLLMSISVTYFQLADYVHAIQYTRKALNIIHANADNQAIDRNNLGKYYYFLS